MSAGCIPVTEIQAYLEIKGITHPEDKMDYLQFIRALDTAWLEHSQEDSEKTKPTKAETRKGTRR